MLFSSGVIEGNFQWKHLTSPVPSNAEYNSNRPRAKKQSITEDQNFISYYCELFMEWFLSALHSSHSPSPVLLPLKLTAVASKCSVLGLNKRIESSGFSSQLFTESLMHASCRSQWSESSY